MIGQKTANLTSCTEMTTRAWHSSGIVVYHNKSQSHTRNKKREKQLNTANKKIKISKQIK